MEIIEKTFGDLNLEELYRKSDEAWDRIPEIDEPEICENLKYDALCPFCGEDVGYQEDVMPLEDIIGKRRYSRYWLRIYRKCPKCRKIFFEDFGEEPENCL